MIFPGQAPFFRFAGHHAGGDLRQRRAGGLGRRRVRCGAARGVDLDEVNLVVFLTANCTFIRPTTPSSSASFVDLLAHLILDGLGQGGRQGAGGVAECPACSMCSMMPPITTSTPSQMASTSTLGGVVQEAVQQYRDSLETLTALEVAAQILLVIDDLPWRGRPARRRAHHQPQGEPTWIPAARPAPGR